MIEIHIPKDIVELASAKARTMVFKKNGKCHTEQVIAGLIGENAFQQWRTEAVHADDKDYDFISKGLRVDVKSRTVSRVPKMHHDHALPIREREQDNDVLVFCAVKKDFSVAWLMGWAWKKEFFEDMAVLRKPGDEKIKDDGTVLKLKMSNFEVTYSKLRPVN